MLVKEMVQMSPSELDLVVEVARAMQPFEDEIARRWQELYDTSRTIHQGEERTPRSFRHAVRVLLTSLGSGDFTRYLRRLQRMGATFANAKERYENLIIFFHFYEESITPCLREAFPERINLVLVTLEHLYHELVAVMSRAYFRELEKDRERFVSTLIHDLRNPLISMTGFARMMAEKRLPKEKEDKVLRIIRESGEKASSLIDHALTYGRLKSKKAFLVVRDIDLIEVVREAGMFLLPESEKRCLHVTINRTHPKDWDYLPPVRVRGDRDLLLRALGNYLSNAVKHARVKIEVSVHARENDVLISVKDDGPGIASEHLSRIFENYYVVPSGKQGIGVGLASVKMIADLCQGKAWAKSSPCEGCTFYFLVPRQQTDHPDKKIN